MGRGKRQFTLPGAVDSAQMTEILAKADDERRKANAITGRYRYSWETGHTTYVQERVDSRGYYEGSKNYREETQPPLRPIVRTTPRGPISAEERRQANAAAKKAATNGQRKRKVVAPRDRRKQIAK